MNMIIKNHKLARAGLLLAGLAIVLLGWGAVGPPAFAAPAQQEIAKPAEPPAQDEVPAKVVPPTLTVTLQDEDGAPIRGVTLLAIAADSTGREKGRATTDPDGKAVFKNLKSGSYYFFANMNAIRQHAGYGMQLTIRSFKTSRTFFLSETRTFDLSANVESAFVIKRAEHIWLETYLQVVRTGKVVIMNQQMGLQHIIPVASTDYLQVYLPMNKMYGIVTIKDDDFDSWVLEIYSHERLRINLL